MAGKVFQNLSRLMQSSLASAQCKICSARVEEDHQHLIEPGRRRLICACNACAMLFGSEGASYKRIPRRAYSLSDFRITNAQWDELMIPIGMAIFFKSSPGDHGVALYPSTEGPIELPLPPDAWEQITGGNPVLKAMEPDVEALLVNRTSCEYYLLPIDQCFDLLGLIRSHWGISGESNSWEKLRRSFAGLEA